MHICCASCRFFPGSDVMRLRALAKALSQRAQEYVAPFATIFRRCFWQPYDFNAFIWPCNGEAFSIPSGARMRVNLSLSSDRFSWPVPGDIDSCRFISHRWPDSRFRLYRNTRTSQETQDHPVLYSARMKASRTTGLPRRWMFG